jgi:hypothetical protein
VACQYAASASLHTINHEVLIMLALSSKFRVLVATALLLTLSFVGAARVHAQVNPASATSAASVAVQYDSPEAVSGQGWKTLLCLGCAALFVAGTAGAILPTAVAILANPNAVKTCALICIGVLMTEYAT